MIMGGSFEVAKPVVIGDIGTNIGLDCGLEGLEKDLGWLLAYQHQGGVREPKLVRVGMMGHDGCKMGWQGS